MKKFVTACVLIAALVMVPGVEAETVECSTGQYGGATCGVSTSETVVEHKTVGAGVADWTIAQVIAVLGVSALSATLLYKLTYRLYILG